MGFGKENNGDEERHGQNTPDHAAQVARDFRNAFSAIRDDYHHRQQQQQQQPPPHN